MRLTEELEGDLEALRRLETHVRRETEAVRLDPGNLSALYALSAHLHRLYGCIEDAAYRVSVHINGEIPVGGGSHKPGVFTSSRPQAGNS
ncbi:MAG: hypothetical protein HYY17_17040 [Planctomycetes bacterium]|nr:hypothetical protein [Planctomycetota bacterium]